MNRRSDLPTATEVEAAIGHLTETTGKAPTILALAKHLGLPNITVRTNFPELVASRCSVTEPVRHRHPAARYHLRTDGSPSLANHNHIDPPSFQEAMQACSAFLDGLIEHAFQELEFQQEMAREFGP